MSVTRDHDRHITFECDDCFETLSVNTSDIYDAYQQAKTEGWIAVKVGGCWEHQCPDCRGVK